VEEIVTTKEVSLACQFEALRPEWTTYPLHYGDNLHPNIDGYRRIATTWCDVIVEINRPKPPVGAYKLLLLHQ
jgi:lysophospholipase L1-like esterase